MSKNDFYKGHRKEIDLRKEFLHTLYGSNREIEKREEGLLRIFRRGPDGKQIRCSCVNPVTDEAAKTVQCPSCRGEKYLWDEEPAEFYIRTVQTESQLADREALRQPGVMITNFLLIYIPYSFDLTLDDKIVRLDLDKEGVPISPLKRREIIRLSSLRDLRLDHARLEFWKANGYVELSPSL